MLGRRRSVAHAKEHVCQRTSVDVPACWAKEEVLLLQKNKCAKEQVLLLQGRDCSGVAAGVHGRCETYQTYHTHDASAWRECLLGGQSKTDKRCSSILTRRIATRVHLELGVLALFKVWMVCYMGCVMRCCVACHVCCMQQGRIIYLGYDYVEPVTPWVHALVAATMFNDYDFKGPPPVTASASVNRLAGGSQ